MMKKGLVTLVCLAVMSALWSWASTTVYLQTKTTSAGGSITAGSTVTSGAGKINYTSFLSTQGADVVVAADATHKISSITLNGDAVSVGDGKTVHVPVSAAGYLDSGKASGYRSQTVVASFVDLNASAPKYWQLQVRKATVGGSIATSRATDSAATTAYPVAQMKLQNYKDTAPVTVTVTPDDGYHVYSVMLNNKPVTLTGDRFVVDPASSTTKVFSVTVSFKQNDLKVKSTTAGVGVPADGLNTKFGGSAVVMVVPTGTSNVVSTLSVGGTADYVAVDSNGNKTAPFTGTVKVTLSNIKSDVSVNATYAYDPKNDIYQACSASCHNNASLPAVAAVYGQWNASKHSVSKDSSGNLVDCVNCHSTMPGGVVKSSVDADSYQITASSAGTEGTNYCSRCHAASVAKVQASVHYTTEAGKLVCTSCHAAGHNPTASAEACSVCHAVVTDHSAETMGNKSCIECHDKHNPKTITGTLGPASAHPAVKLFTFEEVGMQMANGQPVPVMVDENGKGMPYSPKQTCGTAGCHVKNGVDYTYDKISDHAFHSNEGRSEYQDSANGKFDATKNKPWVQSSAMVGKW